MDRLHEATTHLAYEDNHHTISSAGEDRRHGWDRRRKDRRATDQPEPTLAPLSEAEIAALLNGAR